MKRKLKIKRKEKKKKKRAPEVLKNSSPEDPGRAGPAGGVGAAAT
jgi:hypothetical protein